MRLSGGGAGVAFSKEACCDCSRGRVQGSGAWGGQGGPPYYGQPTAAAGATAPPPLEAAAVAVPSAPSFAGGGVRAVYG